MGIRFNDQVRLQIFEDVNKYSTTDTLKYQYSIRIYFNYFRRDFREAMHNPIVDLSDYEFALDDSVPIRVCVRTRPLNKKGNLIIEIRRSVSNYIILRSNFNGIILFYVF